MTTYRSLCRILLIWFLIYLGLIPAKTFSYEVEAVLLDQNAMIFPVGMFIPADITHADDIDFQDIARLFEMRVDLSLPDTGEVNPDRAVLMVRLEIAGGDPVFTVASQPFNVRDVLVGEGWLDNQQLAVIPELHIGQGGEVSPGQVAQFIDGSNMVEGLYVLTVLLTGQDRSPDDWAGAINNNFGIHSETSMAYNPSQVELNQPIDNGTVAGDNPNFNWFFPRNPGVRFQFQLVGHVLLRASDDWIAAEQDIDPWTALEYSNEYTSFLDTTFSAGPAAGGQITTYNYTGTGGERRLEKGRTYFWRVFADAPTLFPGRTVRVQSLAYSFSFGPEAEILGPTDGDLLETNPTFLWIFPPLPDLNFTIEIVRGSNFRSGIHWATIQPGGGGLQRESWSYQYGRSINDNSLQIGNYCWKISANYSADGDYQSAESSVRRFSFFPHLGLIAPGEEIGSASPMFLWSFPREVPVDKFVLEVFEDTPDQEIYSSLEIDGYQRSATLNVPVIMGSSYLWRVKAVADDGVELPSGMSRFTYIPPELTLQRPIDNVEVYTRNPTFYWSWDTPIPFDYGTDYTITVSTPADNIEYARVSLENQTSWRYSGRDLQSGYYNWQVEATIHLPNDATIEDEAQSSFLLASPPDTFSIELVAPQDAATIQFHPLFEWEFPQVPDDYQLEFELSLSSDSAEFDESFSIAGNIRSWAYEGDTLTALATYEWSILARFTPSGEDPHEVMSQVRTFTFEPAEAVEWDEEFPMASLLASMQGNVALEKFSLILRALRSGEVEIANVVIDGEEANLDGIVELVNQNLINVVVINFSQ